jgi:hypothetical protein
VTASVIRIRGAGPLGGGSSGIETLANLALERGPPAPIQRLDDVPFEVVTEAVGVVLGPGQQPGDGFLRVCAPRLPRADPTVEEPLGELAEAAARIVDLLGLLVAAGEKGLVERQGTRRIAG